MRKLPVWRSLLYVPSNVPRFIDGAHKRGADGIILDLEDSVPIAERSAARRELAASAENVARGNANILKGDRTGLEPAIADQRERSHRNTRKVLVD